MFLDQIYIQRLSHGHSLIGSDIAKTFIKAIIELLLPSVVPLPVVQKVLSHLIGRSCCDQSGGKFDHLFLSFTSNLFNVYFTSLRTILLPSFAV